MPVKKRDRNIGHILLSLAKIVGWSVGEIMTLGQVPHLWSGYESYSARERQKLDEKIRQEIYYLLKKEYIVRGADKSLSLTEEGLMKAQSLLGQKTTKLPLNKYLIVLYDIPEKYNRGRDNFRNFLQQNGFNKLQESVWISSSNYYKALHNYIFKAGLDDWVNILIAEKLAFVPDKIKKRLKL